MTEELRKLVDRWSHFAAPSGARQSNDAATIRAPFNSKQNKA
jgi:hypothetical protein